MEIISQRLSITAPAGPSFTVVDSKDSVTTEDVQKTSLSGKQPASARVLDALQRFSRAQGARLRQHAKAVTAFSELANSKKGEGLSRQTDFRKAASLEDALAGVKLSSVLDRPQEEAAVRDLMRSSNDLFGVPECALMPCDDPAMENLLSPLLEKDVKGENLGDIWMDLADKIKQFESGALDGFSKAAKQMKDLFDALTKALAEFDKWMTPDGDNKIDFNVNALKDKLKEVQDKFPPESFTEENTLGGGFNSKDDATKLCEQLQMDPKFCVREDPKTGKYYVCIDTTMLDNIIDSLPESGKMSLVAFNAWKSTFDAQMNRIEDATQERGQKYSNIYSRFESFHKTILSIIQAFTDMMRSFFPF